MGCTPALRFVATALLDATGDLDLAAAVLGHKSVEILRKHYVGDRGQRIAAGLGAVQEAWPDVLKGSGFLSLSDASPRPDTPGPARPGQYTTRHACLARGRSRVARSQSGNSWSPATVRVAFGVLLQHGDERVHVEIVWPADVTHVTTRASVAEITEAISDAEGYTPGRVDEPDRARVIGRTRGGRRLVVIVRLRGAVTVIPITAWEE